MIEPIFTFGPDLPASLMAIVRLAQRRSIAIPVSLLQTTNVVKMIVQTLPHDRFHMICDAESAGPIRQLQESAQAEFDRRRDRDGERINRLNAERLLTDADRELAALQATSTVKPGFLARLLGRTGPSDLIRERTAEWEAKRAAAEAELRRIDMRFSSFELDERRSAREESSLADHTPFPDQLTRPLESMTESLRQLTISHSFETPSPAADHRLIVAAERLTAEQLEQVTTGLLIGDPVIDSPFGRLIASMAKPAWETEGDRIVCRLADRGQDWRAEPVIDNPEIEARFTADDELAEIVFPAHESAAFARRWLAANLDEVRPVAIGTPSWTAGDRIVASWQSIQGADVVESIPGVREFVKGSHASAPTVAVEFDPDHGWTRESAEIWLDEQLARTLPPIVTVSPSHMAAEAMNFAAV